MCWCTSSSIPQQPPEQPAVGREATGRERQGALGRKRRAPVLDRDLEHDRRRRRASFKERGGDVARGRPRRVGAEHRPRQRRPAPAVEPVEAPPARARGREDDGQCGKRRQPRAVQQAREQATAHCVGAQRMGEIWRGQAVEDVGGMGIVRRKQRPRSDGPAHTSVQEQGGELQAPAPLLRQHLERSQSKFQLNPTICRREMAFSLQPLQPTSN